MSAETEYIRGRQQERNGALSARAPARFNARGNDVWADRSGRIYAPGTGMMGGSIDYSSPVTGNGMGNLSRLVGGKKKKRGGAAQATYGTVQAAQSPEQKEALYEQGRQALAAQDAQYKEMGIGAYNLGTSKEEAGRLANRAALEAARENKEHNPFQSALNFLSGVGDMATYILPPGLSTLAQEGLQYNPLSSYYVAPEDRSMAQHAKSLATHFLVNMAGQKAANAGIKAVTKSGVLNMGSKVLGRAKEGRKDEGLWV